jgi:putative transposase
MWNLPAPPGFQGLREDKPLRVYMRHLPHWRQDGATYFVTFRLHDSLPAEKLRELAAWRSEWERSHPRPHKDVTLQELSREVMRRVEAWLDQGMGSSVLRDGAAAEVASAMHYFDGQRYELGSYVVMPNHVHAIVRPSVNDGDSLEIVLKSWKGYAARQINGQLSRRGQLWQREGFDRIIRDEEHLYRCIQYIGTNPTKAGLSKDACPRWVSPRWESLGWRFTEL